MAYGADITKPKGQRYLNFQGSYWKRSNVGQFRDPSEATNSGTAASDPGPRTKPPSKFFALIIGINSYASLNDLGGAVSDALAVKKYLEEVLGVQSSQILLLLNEKATRSAIIQGFNDLAADPRINRDDPIFIFYAGHGSQVTTPKGWKVDDPKVQMLLPHDYCSNHDGQGVHGIPDRTIGALLSRIAKNKGDNIVRMSIKCNNLHPADEELYTYRQSSSIVVTLDQPHVMLSYRNPVVKHGLL